MAPAGNTLELNNTLTDAEFKSIVVVPVLESIMSYSIVVAVCVKLANDTVSIFPVQAWEYPETDTIIKKTVSNVNLRFLIMIRVFILVLFDIY